MNEAATIGHNQPTELDKHIERIEDLLSAAKEWSEKYGVDGIPDQTTADKLADFLSQLTKEIKALDEERKTKGKPHRDKVDAINAEYGALVSMLDNGDKKTSIKATIQGLLTGFLQKMEAERLGRERAAKRAADEALKAAADAEAAASTGGARSMLAAATAQVRVDEAINEVRTIETSRPKAAAHRGRAASLRSFYSAEIVDYNKALAHFANHPDVVDAVLTLANASARADHDVAPPGCKIIEEKRAV